MRSPRFSGWSPTTWSETRCAAAGACPGKSCPPSPKPDNRIAHTAAGPAGWAELSALHSGDTQNPVASAVASDTRDTPAQWQNAPQTPPASAGSPPQPRMLYVGVSGVKCIPRIAGCVEIGFLVHVFSFDGLLCFPFTRQRENHKPEKREKSARRVKRGKGQTNQRE